LLSSLSRQGLNTSQIAQCRRLLQAIPTDMEERQTSGGGSIRVTWNDVEKLLLRAVRLSPDADWEPSRGRSTTHTNLDALASMFETLGKGSDTDKPHDAIDLLFTLTRRPDAVSTEEDTQEEDPGNEKPKDDMPAAGKPADKPQGKPESSQGGESLDELRQALRRCAAQASEPVNLIADDRQEELSILMQMLRTDQKPQVQVRIQKHLRENLKAELQPAEWRIVVEGVHLLVRQRDEERLSGALVMMTDALRRSEFTSSLALLRDVCRDCPLDELAILWPYVINEILVCGKHPDPMAFRELCEIVAKLPPEGMERGLPKLQHLEALRDQHFALDVFVPPPTVLYPIFAQLLDTSRGAFIGERLVNGLRRSPPGWVGEAVLPLMSRFHPKHKRFLAELLRTTGQSRPSKTLLESAGRIIGELLPALPHNRRGRAWVPGSIRSVSRLPVPNARAVLQGIVRGRRLWVFPEWPSACRKAARDMLKQSKSRR
jgi:hypothetical protein